MIRAASDTSLTTKIRLPSAVLSLLGVQTYVIASLTMRFTSASGY